MIKPFRDTLRTLFANQTFPDDDGLQKESPRSSEIFSIEQLERHAKFIASQHQVGPGAKSDRLMLRLGKNEEVLLKVQALLAQALVDKARISPAGEWLLDNFHLIEEQIRTIREHLPKRYSGELPICKEGKSAGLPRVYDMATEIICHVDSRVDRENLTAFVSAYQTVHVLKLGEIWAIPIMLRLALIENLRRVAIRVAVGIQDRKNATHWAARLADMAEHDPKNLILLTADMARSALSLSNSFVAEFLRQLKSKRLANDIPLVWLNQQLVELGSSAQQSIETEAYQQAENQVNISSSIGSLRTLATTDWSTFTEALSIVEHELRLDPASVYLKMDFATRDRYRHRVEKLARISGKEEIEIAKSANILARETISNNEILMGHNGYYLIGEGASRLAKMVGIKSVRSRLLDSVESKSFTNGGFLLICYVSCVIALTVASTAVLWRYLDAPIWALAVTVTLALFCASSFAINFVNWCVTLFINPGVLPRLDFSKGIPEEFASIVVFPSLLSSKQNVEKLLEGLEICFLANREPQLFFGLLSDFCDAQTECENDDQALIEQATAGIEHLNEKYKRDHQGVFFLFHRNRLKNNQEAAWIGYERKRGKLNALNTFLENPNAGHTAFATIVGNVATLPKIKYVITLDTDTFLPKDAAQKLIGTMAHPLNQPCFDEVSGRVTKGYGILQPRVAAKLPSSSRSLFSRLSSGETAVDPYTKAVSDIYHDLFQEGSFFGKGIYDVSVFQRALVNRLPENLILSHDLLEGAYTRCGLVSDVILYEDQVHHFDDDIRRRHRWVRGDWQIIRWLFRSVPNGQGTSCANPLSWLSKWKILDNLRRSLLPSATFLLLLFSWLVLKDSGRVTIFVLAMLLLAPFYTSLVSLIFAPPKTSFVSHVRKYFEKLGLQIANAILTLVFLPYEAQVHADAIGRACFRMFISKKNLLEWKSTSHFVGGRETKLKSFFRSMFWVPVLSGLLLVMVIRVSPHLVPLVLFFVCLWIASPAVAYFLSRVLPVKTHSLTPSQKILIRLTARKTWRFFDEFIAEGDSWLPPDNFQEAPIEIVAHRTSPTNIGLGLLSFLAAYDFCYISGTDLLQRLAKTVSSLNRMERFRGHFYNWYDTQTLLPLQPLYVSTVDSGNLSGMLFTLKGGLEHFDRDDIFSAQSFLGLQDTIRVLCKDWVRESVNGSQRNILPAPIVTLSAALTGLEGTSVSLKTITEIVQKIQPLIAEADAFFGGTPILVSKEIGVWWQSVKLQWEQCIQKPLSLFFDWLPLVTQRRTQWETLLQGRADQDAAPIKALEDCLILSETICSRRDLVAWELQLRRCLVNFEVDGGYTNAWVHDLALQTARAANSALQEIHQAHKLGLDCHDLALFEFDFLYDRERHLLSIGYNIRDHRKDASFYDLLASEARLASYLGIAFGRLPQSHWFALGRLLTSWHNDPVLLSWSGSMFEYLMPQLIMPCYRNTLLEKTYSAVTARQIHYGKQRGVPWGISESGYYATDAQLNYQYRAFGVPGLGFKGGLADDLVIAPYASLMSIDFASDKVCENLEKLQQMGAEGRFGFYEALDFTAPRVATGKEFSIVQSFMSHHQGMALVALSNHLLGHRMHSRFLSVPEFQAVEMLLQERIPQVEMIYPHAPEVSAASTHVNERESALRVIATPHTSRPKVHLLSNGRYSVAITNSGGGYSRWKDCALTRWREDPTCDNWGTFCYIRDLETGNLWSSAYQPTLKEPEFYEAIFPTAKAEFRRRDDDIELHTEITVSPEDDIELRRYTLTNRSAVARIIELTTYAEVALSTQAADESHQAFGNLFIQTEILPDRQAILCTRRPRSAHEQALTLVHLLTSHSPLVYKVSYETDRGKFLGRTQGLSQPTACTSVDGTFASRVHQVLSGSQGSVLDAVLAIRCVVRIPPDETVSVHCVTGVGENRAAAEHLIEKYHDRHVASRVFEVAWSHRQIFLRQLNLLESEVQIYERMTSALLYADPTHRASVKILQSNKQGQPSLWGYGISGDLPIVVLRISSAEKMDLVRQLIQAHGYWKAMGLAVDLVLWNEENSSYLQLLNEQILSLINATFKSNILEQPGGIFVKKACQIPDQDGVLLFTLARLLLWDSEGTLQEQMDRRPLRTLPRLPPLLLPTHSLHGQRTGHENHADVTRSLQFFNRIGGFSEDFSEYVMRLPGGVTTPAPWSNVLANPFFGSVVTESGSAYTWCENAHEFRLTPWNNDAVRDTGGECFYLRDDETGEFWSPMPLPTRSATPYIVRHGFGYSEFINLSHNIESSVTVFVPLDAPVKISLFRIKNHSKRARNISVTGYCEWVLGELRTKSLLHLVSEKDTATGTVFVRNAYHPEFGSRLAFFDSTAPITSFTCDRSEFLGRNGTLQNPKALRQISLSGRIGAGLDSCTALQSLVTLAPGEVKEIVFVLGVGRDTEDARALLKRFRNVTSAIEVLDSVKRFWKKTLDQVEVQTPDPAINALMKGWLVYQTLSSRVWARSGFYQSGGAFGFRDQLQDVMALVHTRPDLLREQIVRCSGRQYKEGDVQHWWHPPTGKGVRTHFSDDYLWLPLAVARYVEVTLDTSILEIRVPFLEGRHVKPDEEAYYDLPLQSEQTASLYDHCVRAISKGLQFGSNGLPLIGCGDWNDGMNLVGAQGKGESVWLAFFLFDVCTKFAKISQLRGDAPFAELCQTEAKKLQINIEKNAWDGNWYRRAYFDDGQPLGSSQSQECQIDSLPQSWAVLSGAGDPDRSRTAMEFVKQRLVDKHAGIIKLFDPPFDKSEMNPGYIKGYVPGVRENGGQYTHAAIWTTMAFASLGDSKTAWELMNLINPIRHGSTPAGVDIYKVEPYVVAADVYAVAPHVGRGGWTWYTGSAGWMYRLILESLLGLERKGNRLYFLPCVPQEWKSYQVTYRYEQSVFCIVVVLDANNLNKTRIKIDNQESEQSFLELFDDNKTHQVEVQSGCIETL